MAWNGGGSGVSSNRTFDMWTSWNVSPEKQSSLLTAPRENVTKSLGASPRLSSASPSRDASSVGSASPQYSKSISHDDLQQVLLIDQLVQSSGGFPSRTLFVRRGDPTASDEILSSTFAAYGDIRALHTEWRRYGFLLVSYFDIRHAENAMHGLQSMRSRNGQPGMVVKYSLPLMLEESEKNQGTLVVFNLDVSVSEQEIRSLFGQFGAIRDVRSTPNKHHQRFVEYYDVRESDAAVRNLNKSEVHGRKIKIEPSHPGGSRKEHIESFNRALKKLSQKLAAPAAPAAALPPPPPPMEFPPYVTMGNAIPSLFADSEALPSGMQTSPCRLDLPPRVDPLSSWPWTPLHKSAPSSPMYSPRDDGSANQEDNTMIVVKSIPRNVTQKTFQSVVDLKFPGRYDFLFLPFDNIRKCNRGIAFINFHSPDFVWKFFSAFHLRPWAVFGSERVCEVEYCKFQNKGDVMSQFPVVPNTNGFIGPPHHN